MQRLVTTVQIRNNPTSVPPLELILKTNGKTFRGIAVAGMFLIASGGAPGYTYAASGLPAGLSLNAATGEITGTATTIAHNVITATATDSSTNSATLDFSLDVLSRLDFEQKAPPPAERNYNYSGYQFNVKGATGSVTYAIISGSLPAGLSLTGGGYIAPDPVTQTSGTDKTFVVRATDSGTGDTLDIFCVIHTYSEFKTTISSTHNTITVGVPTFIDGGSAGYLGGVPPFKSVAGTLPAGLSIVFDTNTHGVTVTASAPFAQTLIHFTSTDALGYSPGVNTGFYLTAIDPQQKLIMKDGFGDVADPNPATVTIKSTDGSVIIDTSASSGEDTVYDLSIAPDSSGITPWTNLYFRSDQLVATAGNDTLTLDQTPYDVASSTLTITLNGMEVDYTSDISFVGNVGTFASPMIGGEIVVPRYWATVIPGATTLTTTIVFVYATLDPANKSANITLSNGNRTGTLNTNSTYAMAKATIALSGKMYFEGLLVSVSAGQDGFGIADSSASLTGWIGQDTHSWGYGVANDGTYHNGIKVYADSATVADVCCCAVDVPNGKMWLRKNNSAWVNGGDPVAGTSPTFSGLSGTLFAAISGGLNTDQITMNFDPADFAFTPPSGYGPVA